MLKWCKGPGLADYAHKKSCNMQAWQHLTLRLLYSERLDGAKLLLLCLIARIPSLFLPQFLSSVVNLTFGIEIQYMNGCMWHK